jgi:hypothetical protein
VSSASAAKLVAALPSSNSFERLTGFLRIVLVCTAAVAVVILAFRSAIGPFPLWGIHVMVNSPFRSESVFWLAIFGLFWFCRQSEAIPESGQSIVARFPAIPLTIVLCLIAAAFARNLADPFLSDDYILLSSPPFNWKAFLSALDTPGGDGSFRPLGTLYYQFTKVFAGLSPVKWHLVGLALHLLNSALVFAIAWRLWRDKTAAAVSSLVFGLNGTRPEAALWTAGACDPLACACVLGSIGLALSRRTANPKYLPIVCGLLSVVGVLFKESAYALPLVAFWILWSRGSFRSFRNAWIVICGVCLALFAWRWHLFHGPGGYILPATGRPAILSLHPLTAAKVVFVRMWAILLAPIDWDASMSWWMPLAIVASMLGLLSLAAAAGSNAATRRTRLCLIAASCCAVLPAIHVAAIGQSGLSSRVLYLAGAPFALLIGSMMPACGKRRLAIAAIMLLGMAAILEHNLSAWHNAALEARALCGQTTTQPDTPAPATFQGVPLLKNGFAECTAAARNGLLK